MIGEIKIMTTTGRMINRITDQIMVILHHLFFLLTGPGSVLVSFVFDRRKKLRIFLGRLPQMRKYQSINYCIDLVVFED